MTTINHECYVSLEVAKLLEKAGFDWACRDYYYPSFITSQYSEYAKPTLEVAQRWLREVKGFMIEMTFITDEYSILYQANLYEIVSEKSKRVLSELISVVRGQSELKRTYEEAQEAGIKKALEMILEKDERGYGLPGQNRITLSE